jgi:hypothetical protein
MTFEVEGTGAFPIDMLRYDACYPATEGDSHIITATMHRGGVTANTVTLKTADPKRPPTVERWRSFGWTLVNG